MQPHPSAHLIAVLGVMAATVALMAVVRNRVIQRRLRLTLIALTGLVALHFAIVEVPAVNAFGPAPAIEKLLGTLAIINALITLLFNPWFKDRAADRAPAIVQDTILVALVVLAGTLIFENSVVFATSAIVAAAVGFALQDTLSNVFAGLSLQIEKPFRVGHWIVVSGHEGLVTEVTWRATKIRTKAGNLVIVPNNTIAKEAINNYSEPALPTRLEVDVGATYLASPNDVRSAIHEALAQSKFILRLPAPDVLLVDFAASAITYRARFWVDDFSKDQEVKDEVRRAIYYALGRHGIEIPWPIQVEYQRPLPIEDRPAQQERFRQTIAAVPVLAPLSGEVHDALADSAHERLYGDGEAIVREGEPGGSMFVVCRGRVAITVGPERREVAVTEAGGYFGEMSLLTGEPRTATVSARGDSTVLEINANAFRAYVQDHPEVIDALATAAVTRRRALEDARTASVGSHAAERSSLAQRMRRFFGLRP